MLGNSIILLFVAVTVMESFVHVDISKYNACIFLLYNTYYLLIEGQPGLWDTLSFRKRS